MCPIEFHACEMEMIRWLPFPPMNCSRFSRYLSKNCRRGRRKSRARGLMRGSCFVLGIAFSPGCTERSCLSQSSIWGSDMTRNNAPSCISLLRMGTCLKDFRRWKTEMTAAKSLNCATTTCVSQMTIINSLYILPWTCTEGILSYHNVSDQLLNSNQSYAEVN